MRAEWARRVAKGMTAGLLHYSGLRRAMCAVRRRQSGGRRITIVSYHRVVEDFTGELQRSIPGLLISKETFRRQLEEAHASGYEFTTLDETLEVLSGRKRARRDLFVVTFDDGYREVSQHALPILKAMGVPAISYLPVGYVGTGKRLNHDRLFHLLGVARARGLKPLYSAMPPAAAVLLEPVFAGRKAASEALDEFIAEYPTSVLQEVIDSLERQLGGGPELLPEQGELMSWDEVRAMCADGFQVGAHTVGHNVLTLESPERVDEEIRLSKETLERETGQPVAHFAYCNGWYSDEVVSALVRHGFRSAVTTEDLPNNIGGDPFAVKRKVLWENFSIGMTGEYSPSLTGCQLDDVFGILKVNRPVLGKRPHGWMRASPNLASRPERGV